MLARLVAYVVAAWSYVTSNPGEVSLGLFACAALLRRARLTWTPAFLAATIRKTWREGTPLSALLGTPLALAIDALLAPFAAMFGLGRAPSPLEREASLRLALDTLRAEHEKVTKRVDDLEVLSPVTIIPTSKPAKPEANRSKPGSVPSTQTV